MQRVLRKNQTGIVSIMVTMILMIVITLIVLGFSAVSRRNQREALDQQLSTQAYYAAETGVNDAYAALTAATPATVSPQGLNAPCTTFMAANGLTSKSTLSASSNTSYTCLLVSDTPNSLVYDNLQPGSQTVTPLVCFGGGCNIASLNFTWQPKQGSSVMGTCPSAGTFSPNNSSGWQHCNYGIVRVDLVPTTSVNATALIANTKTAFIVPTSAGSVVTTSLSSAVTLASSGGCGSPNYACSATLNVPAMSQYYARITMLYTDTARLTITAKDASGNAVNFSGGQAVIDSTGKAQDELKRIQVRVPLGLTSNVPINALQTTDSICKRFSIVPGGAATPASLCAP